MKASYFSSMVILHCKMIDQWSMIVVAPNCATIDGYKKGYERKIRLVNHHVKDKVIEYVYIKLRNKKCLTSTSLKVGINGSSARLRH